MASLPIFYDEKQKRWSRSRNFFWFLFVVMAGVFLGLLLSVTQSPILPKITLQDIPSALRSAPNEVVHGIAGDVPQTLFDSEAYAAKYTTTSPQGVPQNSLAKREQPSKMMAFYVNWDENSYESLKQNINTIDVLVPEWLHLGQDGQVIINEDVANIDQTKAYIQVEKPTMTIMPMINNFNEDTQDFDQDILRRAIADEVSRNALAQNLYSYVRDNSFQGISIDFENVPEDFQPQMLSFIQEVSRVFHEQNLQVTMNIPLEDDSFQAKPYGDAVDQLILMAYDEHSIDASTAGPIASLGWMTQALEKRYLELPSEKYILALGGYGYDWDSDTTEGDELTYAQALRLAQESKADIVLNAQSLNPTFDYYEADNTLHHVWFLDAVSLFNQLQSANLSGHPYGYALWRLGSEDPSLWSILRHRDALSEMDANALTIMRNQYDISYKGDGEILRVDSIPHEGNRRISYNTASGFIQNESVVKYPSSYVVHRFGGTDPKKIALTFDDGPDEKYTPAILDILKKYNVHASFFIMGMNAQANPDLLRRIDAEGHEIGNHTFTHPNIATITQEQFHLELDATERLLESTLGRKSLLFRPPYAEDIAPTSVEHIRPLMVSSEAGYYTAGINIDPKDWSKPGEDAIVSSVIDQAHAGVGSIVLMHDSGGDRTQTVAALPRIIETLQSEGYVFVSTSEMLGISHDDIMPPLSEQEKLATSVNRVAFFSMFSVSEFLKTIFIAGIIMGIIRIVFISMLAVVQWFRVRKEIRMIDGQAFSPKVVVLIPAYNEAKVITQTIDALLVSTYPQRIIVIDDGSTDNTLEVLKERYENNENVRYYTKVNGGKSLALNCGMRFTDESDEIIVTLDADTLFLPNTIERLVRRFIREDVAAVAGNAKVGNRINILTKWQALEYITSQNLDRRAFEILNCITVVPGSVGAWRRSALLEAGGFSEDTLAEDADLTVSIVKTGKKVVYESEAMAFTEAPDTVKNFIKQRYRWMFGTMQVAWKHKHTLFDARYGMLGFVALPNIFIFQLFFVLVSPFMDIALIFSIIWAFWQKYQHPFGFDMTDALQGMLFYYFLFLIIDMATSILPFLIERKETMRLIWYIPLQRFFYRQLMYYVAIKTVLAAIKGRFVKWGSIERKATSHANALFL